jgi:hypothetical protein
MLLDHVMQALISSCVSDDESIGAKWVRQVVLQRDSCSGLILVRHSVVVLLVRRVSPKTRGKSHSLSRAQPEELLAALLYGKKMVGLGFSRAGFRDNYNAHP